MLVIRLFRVGKKNQPSFKIVITDKRNPPRGGRFVEEVGFYNPRTKEKVFKKERIQYWLSKGVKPSATVHNLLVKEGVLEGGKIPVHKKSKEQKEAVEVKLQPAEEKKPASAASDAAPKGKEEKAEKKEGGQEEKKTEESASVPAGASADKEKKE